MDDVKLRYQRVSDAKRFYAILNNPNFLYFNVKPESLKEEIEWLKGNAKRRKNNREYNYSILFNNKLVGACGVKIDHKQKHTGEIGYFLDEAYWGKGITTQAVKLLERIGFNKLKLKRIEIFMNTKNTASERVAIKCRYEKQGVVRKFIKAKNVFQNDYLYFKEKQ